MSVLLTAIGIPSVREDALLRPRLLHVLKDGFSRRLILVTAEAGYGKTTIMAQFARGLEWPVGWYTATEEGRDPGTFLASLIAAIEVARPGITFTAAQVLGSLADPAGGWRTVASALINDLAQGVPDPMLVVVDDLHVVSAGAAADIPGYLAAHLPGPIRLALLSRTRPVSPEIVRLGAQGEALVLDSHALAFTPEEVSSVLQDATGSALPPDDVAVVCQQTEGWPLAVQLLRQAIRAEGRQATIRRIQSLGRGPCELYDYFGTQVLDRLPEDLRRFLLQISILDPLEPDVCENLTGVPNARAVLRDLEQRGVFLTALDAQMGQYRLHPLFRETLQTLLEQREGPDEVRRLRRAAGRFLGETGRAVQAVPFLLAAADYETVLRYLEAHGERWIQEGRGKAVADWMAAMSPEVVEGSPAALFLLGWLATYRGDWRAALRWLAKGAPLATGDAAATARYVQASVLELLDRHVEARQMCETALALPGLTPLARARLLRRMAKIDVWSGAMAQAEKRYEEAMSLFEEAGDLNGQVQVLHELVFLNQYLDPGQDWPERFMAKAMALYREAQLLAVRVEAATVAGILLNARGDHHRALAVLEETREGARHLDDCTRLLNHLSCYGTTLLALGRFQEAGNALAEGLRLAEERRIPHLVQTLRSSLGHLAWQEGRLRDAADLFRRAIEDCRSHHLAIYLPGGLVMLALVTAEMGNVDDARTYLGQARERFLEWGAARRAAECVLLLAALDVRRSPDGAASPGLADALEGARRHELYELFVRHPGLLVPLLSRALVEGIEVPYTAGILAAAGDPTRVSPALAHPDPAVRVRSVEILERMGSEQARSLLNSLAKDPDAGVRARAREALTTLSKHPPAPLRVGLLGGFEVRKGSAPLPPCAWRRRRDRLLLAFLLLAREPVARGVLLEALWPDRDPASAGHSLNVAWSNLRHALEPGIPDRTPSAYLSLESGRYGLRRTSLTTDIWEFERLLALARQSSVPDQQVRHLDEAVGLYRGDLLPDDANEPWTVQERERVRLVYLSALEMLAEGRVRQGRSPEAADVLRAILKMEPWREDAYRQLMRVLAGLGRRSEALYLYRQCEALLRRELDVAPSPETVALFEDIAAGRPV